MVAFTVVENTDLPVFRNENYRLVECYNGNIAFSYAQKGRAMTIHFSSTKKGLKRVRVAAKHFCEWIFRNYPDCTCLLAVIKKDNSGVKKVARRCGFTHLAYDNKHDIFVREKWAAYLT